MAPPIREHRAGLAKPLGCHGLHCLLAFLALTLCAHFFARRTPTLSALSSMLRDQCIQDSSNAFLTQLHLPSHLFPLSLFFEAETYGESKFLAISAAFKTCYYGGSRQTSTLQVLSSKELSRWQSPQSSSHGGISGENIHPQTLSPLQIPIICIPQSFTLKM